MQEKSTVFLPSAYLPNIQYVSKLLSYPLVYIEVCDTYQKQSYRNRTSIYGANGKQDLIIPVKRPNGNQTFTKDVLLDYDMPWQHVHWHAIVSAYKHSPFFEIFEFEMAHVYERKEKFLLDWNFKILEIIFSMTDTELKYEKTQEYIPQIHPPNHDFREIIHPKARMQKPDRSFKPETYFQVFLERHGFIGNLSFIDLLFNEGPQAIFLCKSYTKKGHLI